VKRMTIKTKKNTQNNLILYALIETKNNVKKIIEIDNLDAFL
jgi:hypothetical protein